MLNMAPPATGRQREAFSCFTPGNEYEALSATSHPCLVLGLFFEAVEVEVWELKNGCSSLVSH